MTCYNKASSHLKKKKNHEEAERIHLDYLILRRKKDLDIVLRFSISQSL